MRGLHTGKYVSSNRCSAITPGQLADAVPNAEVEVLALEIDDRGARTNVEVEVRMRGDEAADARQQPARRERRHHGHADAPLVDVRRRLAHRVGESLERFAHAQREALAGFGDPHAASRAGHQLDPEVLFERA